MAAANGYGKIAVSNWGYRTYGYDDSFGDYPYDLELAKQYDSEEAAGFINGIMGAFVEKEVKA